MVYRTAGCLPVAEGAEELVAHAEVLFELGAAFFGVADVLGELPAELRPLGAPAVWASGAGTTRAPAAQVANPPVLPVIVAFSGQPGSPADLFRLGNLHHRLDAIARAHHGVAPIVVSVDQLGAPERNPMCLNSPLGNVTTYVTTDVTNWITGNLNVSRDRSNWGLLGFSQGATCTMQYLSAHSDRFSSALAISSQIAPITGNPQHSAAAAFSGSIDAWKAAAPQAVMTRHGAYRDTSVVFVFVTGATDATSTTNVKQLSATAQTVGIRTRALSSPGSGHDWKTVRYAFKHGLPVLAKQLSAAGAETKR